MWTSLTLAAALTLAPAQAGGLRLANERLTYGTLGPTRTDSKFLPGDVLSMTFDLEGLKTESGGKVAYSLAFQVSDAKGKLVYAEDPRDLEAILHLGGHKVPASPFVLLPTDMAAGPYEFKMTVRDRTANTSQTLTRKFEVQSRGFGLVALQVTNGNIQTPPLGVVGQELFLNFTVVGFDRDKVKKQPNVVLEMNILDDKKKPTLDRPITGTFSDNVPENSVAVPAYFLLKLNRAGNYTVELKAADQVTKKTSALSLPLRVFE